MGEQESVQTCQGGGDNGHQNVGTPKPDGRGN